MAIKVIARRREVKLGKKSGIKFVMRPDLYIPIAEKKFFAEAATYSGIDNGGGDNGGGGDDNGGLTAWKLSPLFVMITMLDSGVRENFYCFFFAGSKKKVIFASV